MYMDRIRYSSWRLLDLSALSVVPRIVVPLQHPQRCEAFASSVQCRDSTHLWPASAVSLEIWAKSWAATSPRFIRI